MFQRIKHSHKIRNNPLNIDRSGRWFVEDVKFTIYWHLVPRGEILYSASLKALEELKEFF